MNEYYRDDRDYRENYRSDNYRDDYRDDSYRDDYRNYRGYRESYRDRYGRNYRDRYGRNYRSQDEYHMILNELVEDGMEMSRNYEDAADMTNNSKDKNTLMKISEREKEHYRAVKEILEKGM